MASRFGSALSACSSKHQSEAVEIVSSSDELDDNEDNNQITDDSKLSAVDQPQPSFLWRLSSGALGGVYNVASGAAGMGYNTTKWVLGKGVEVGTNAVVASKDMSGSMITKTAEVGSTIVGKLPVPSRLKAKDKKE